jgi:hypothetical protein
VVLALRLAESLLRDIPSEAPPQRLPARGFPPLFPTLAGGAAGCVVRCPVTIGGLLVLCRVARRLLCAKWPQPIAEGGKREAKAGWDQAGLLPALAARVLWGPTLGGLPPHPFHNQ